MKYSIIFTTIITLVLTSQLVTAGSIADTYAAGDTLTATKMENIKTAVNHNDGNISTNTTAIVGNTKAIEGNTKAIEGNTTNIGVNDGRIKDLEALSGVTSYLSIPARGGFQPYNNEASFADCAPDTFGWNGTGSSLFVATVNLPHNATITGFTYYFWRDTRTILETTATLYRQSIPAKPRESIGRYTSIASDSGHTSGDAKVDVTRNTVDNQNYTYYIEADLPVAVNFIEEDLPVAVNSEAVNSEAVDSEAVDLEAANLCTDGARITYTTP